MRVTSATSMAARSTAGPRQASSLDSSADFHADIQDRIERAEAVQRTAFVTAGCGGVTALAGVVAMAADTAVGATLLAGGMATFLIGAAVGAAKGSEITDLAMMGAQQAMWDLVSASVSAEKAPAA
ncbi:MAG: hypothetical protein HY319_19975 [Armatimonadetes bacterium]|nr:hypothetical protein [Armatimonadota bacterium]